MTTKDYLDEYAHLSKWTQSCEELGCTSCTRDNNRMQEIIQELEASIRKDERDECEKRLKDGVYEKLIRKEVVADMLGYSHFGEDYLEGVEKYRLSKGIEIK